MESNMFTVKEDILVGKYGPIDIFLHAKTCPVATDASKVGKIVIDLPDYMHVKGWTAGNPNGCTQGPKCTFGPNQKDSSYCELFLKESTKPIYQIVIHTPKTEGLESCPLSIKLSTTGDWTNSSCEFGFGLPNNVEALGLKTYHLTLYDDTAGNVIEEGWYKLDSII